MHQEINYNSSYNVQDLTYQDFLIGVALLKDILQFQ